MRPTIPPSKLSPITLEPIGVLRTPFGEKLEAPRQAVAAENVEGTVELRPGRNFEDALADLEGFERIWIVFWFDAAIGWKPKIEPPRSDKKRGLFATRSPHRPNPIGLSSVALVGVEGLTVRVRGLDMLDGTPVLDLKPYVPYCDAFPSARAGWLEETSTAKRGDEAAPSKDPKARFEVVWSELAKTERAFLEARGVATFERVEALLAESPRPHAYRRIKKDGDGFRLAFKDLRFRFRVDGHVVTLLSIATGYRASELAKDPSLETHRAFVAAFGDRA